MGTIKDWYSFELLLKVCTAINRTSPMTIITVFNAIYQLYAQPVTDL